MTGDKAPAIQKYCRFWYREPLEKILAGPVTVVSKSSYSRIQNDRLTNQSPDHRGIVEDSSARAIELADLVAAAHVREDATEGPEEDGSLHDARPERSDQLTKEHGSGRQLQVVAQFHVLHKGKSLSHCNVSISLEQHHGIWSSGQHVSDEELGENVETKLDVCNGLDHANGNHPDCGNDNRKYQSPPSHFCRPDVDDDKREGKAGQENAHKPPPRDGVVLAHHTSVNVVLCTFPGLVSIPEFATMEDTNVRDDR